MQLQLSRLLGNAQPPTGANAGEATAPPKNLPHAATCSWGHGMRGHRGNPKAACHGARDSLSTAAAGRHSQATQGHAQSHSAPGAQQRGPGLCFLDAFDT